MHHPRHKMAPRALLCQKRSRPLRAWNYPNRTECTLPVEHALAVHGPEVAAEKFARFSTMAPEQFKQSAALISASYQAHLAHHLGKQGISQA